MEDSRISDIPNTVILPVSASLDVVVHPPSESCFGSIRVVTVDGSVVLGPGEVRELVAQLVEAALMLAEWQ